jgi:hypothetical protein
MRRGSLVCCNKHGVEKNYLYKRVYVTSFKVMQMSVFCTLLPDVVCYNLWLNPKYVNVIGLHKAELKTPGHRNQLTFYGVEITRAFNSIQSGYHVSCRDVR